MAETYAKPDGFRTWAEIDLGAIAFNLAQARKAIGPSPEFLAVVKANAYGHGAGEVARAIAPAVSCFGVACLDEAIEISHLGRDILLLGPCLPSERAKVVSRDLIASVSSAEEARSYAAHGACRLNFKIDTGMGRIGCWKDHAVGELEKISHIKQVSLYSISTHPPSADEDPEFTRCQLNEFAGMRESLACHAPDAKFHCLNSAGIFGFPEFAADMVRVGLSLYGCIYPQKFQHLLRPALAWKARLLTLRNVGPGRTISYGRTYVTSTPTRVASVSVGYADGYPRQASGKGAAVLIHGKRCPILGRITMDQIVVDVTEVADAQEGDEVVLIGAQENDEITAHDLASKADTIAWHLFTGLTNRVRRVYFGQQPGGNGSLIRPEPVPRSDYKGKRRRHGEVLVGPD